MTSHGEHIRLSYIRKSCQRQSTLDCRYLTLLCDNMKKRMFLQNFFSWHYLGNLLCSTMFHYVPLCSTMFHYVPLCSTMFHYVPLCSTMFHYVPLCSTSFHYSAAKQFHYGLKNETLKFLQDLSLFQ
jgi:hypothetical protein